MALSSSTLQIFKDLGSEFSPITDLRLGGQGKVVRADWRGKQVVVKTPLDSEAKSVHASGTKWQRRDASAASASSPRCK